jgi:hypothetical protein
MLVTNGAALDAPAAFAGRAFGVRLRGDFRVPGLLEPVACRHVRHPGERHIELTLRDADNANATWPARSASRTFELRDGHRRIIFTIDHEPHAGYRVWIAGLGQCLIGPRGDRVVCSPARGRDRWHLLIGQGLPIAAALHGLEVLHASAVCFGSSAVAFVAPSGTGKTSLALHLLAHGAAFLADDVVALEADGEELLAHPGIGLAHAPSTEREALASAGVQIRWPGAAGRKRRVTVPLPDAPAPLRIVYFLERTRAVSATEIVPIDPPDPRVLLGATFVSHVPTAARLITQLDICSRIARTVPLFRVRSPIDGHAAILADLIARHIRTTA